MCIRMFIHVYTYKRTHMYTAYTTYTTRTTCARLRAQADPLEPARPPLPPLLAAEQRERQPPHLAGADRNVIHIILYTI